MASMPWTLVNGLVELMTVLPSCTIETSTVWLSEMLIMRVM